MDLYTIRGGSVEALENREYQIGVGISLGNKWFTAENITEAVQWSLLKTREKVIVYVADSIHAINIEVRGRISKNKAQEKASLLGNKILEEVKDVLKKELSTQDFSKVVFAKWEQLVDKEYQKKVNYLYEKYKEDSAFKDSIHNLVKSFTKNEARTFSDDDINRLGDYIIEELPECLCGVQIAGYECDAYIYPYDGELPKFVEDIQNARIFPEIRDFVIDAKTKVFIEVR